MSCGENGGGFWVGHWGGGGEKPRLRGIGFEISGWTLD